MESIGNREHQPGINTHGNDALVPDFLPLATLREIQEHRWREVVAEAFLKSPFYRQRFGAHGISSVGEVHSITQLPTMDSQDVLNHGELIALEGSRIAAVYCSGGTSQTPKMIFRSLQDMHISAQAAIRMFECGGVESHDTVMILQPFGIWAIGSIAFNALATMGCRVLPVGAGIPEEITSRLCSRFRPSVIYTSPRYARELTRRFKELGIDCRALGIRMFLLAGERFGHGTRDFLAWEWGADTVDIYGSEETDGLGADCPFHRGLHLLDDQFFFEVLDLDAQVTEKGGHIGELVLTTLTKQAYPLIRYRNGDIVQVLGGQCECGRTSQRIRVIGRKDERLVLMGAAKIYAFQLDRALEPFAADIAAYQLLCRTDGSERDQLELRVVPQAQTADLDLPALRSALVSLSLEMSTLLNSGAATLEIAVVSSDDLHSTVRGKSSTFVDLRRDN